MSALPVLGAYTYRVFVRARYIADARPLYTTLHMATTHAPATEEQLDIAVTVLLGYVEMWYKSTCSEDIAWLPIQVRDVHSPQRILYESPEWRNPIGGGGAPAPRAMSVNVVIKPEDAEGRNQHNRQQQFGVPLDQIATGYHGQYAPLFVSSRLIWLTWFRDAVATNPLFMAVYSPSTDLTYIAHTIYEMDISGTRETRMTGHKRK
jgi:hypothetical protein